MFGRVTNVASWLLVTLSVVTMATAQTDLTRTDGAYGEDVVTATLALLADTDNCLIGNDFLFLRRFAYTVSNYGSKPGIFDDNSGGIWQISEELFNKTQGFRMGGPKSKLVDVVRDQFDFNWFDVEYSDLQKPLYSALSAIFIALPSEFPVDLESQGQFYSFDYKLSKSEFIQSDRDFRKENDCYREDDPESYQGDARTTASGRLCQAWSDKRSYGNLPEDWPDKSQPSAQKNYCRSPSDFNQEFFVAPPWCYYGPTEDEWEYCDVPVCTGLCSSANIDLGILISYTGRTNKDQFIAMRNFTADLISSFKIGKDGVRVALGYNYNKNFFGFLDYSTTESATEAVEGMEYILAVDEGQNTVNTSQSVPGGCTRFSTGFRSRDCPANLLCDGSFGCYEPYRDAQCNNNEHEDPNDECVYGQYCVKYEDGFRCTNRTATPDLPPFLGNMTEVFTKGNGMRDDSVKILVFVTDGDERQTENPGNYSEEFQKLKDAGVVVLIVGVTDTDGQFKAKLSDLASEPKCQRAFPVQDYDMLEGIVTAVEEAACKAEVVQEIGSKYTYKCGQEDIIKIDATEQEAAIAIFTEQGSVEIFGGYNTNIPNTALSIFSSNATSKPLVLYLTNQTKPLFLRSTAALVSSQCYTTYTITAVPLNTTYVPAVSGATRICLSDSKVVECNEEELLSQELCRKIDPKTDTLIVNTCTAGGKGFHKHPYTWETAKYIYCGSKAWECGCPEYFEYNPYSLSCVSPTVQGSSSCKSCSADLLDFGFKKFPILHGGKQNQYLECTDVQKCDSKECPERSYYITDEQRCSDQTALTTTQTPVGPVRPDDRNLGRLCRVCDAQNMKAGRVMWPVATSQRDFVHCLGVDDCEIKTCPYGKIFFSDAMKCDMQEAPVPSVVPICSEMNINLGLRKFSVEFDGVAYNFQCISVNNPKVMEDDWQSCPYEVDAGHSLTFWWGLMAAGLASFFFLL